MHDLMSFLQEIMSLSRRIINGEEAEKHSHPYIASIQVCMVTVFILVESAASRPIQPSANAGQYTETSVVFKQI